MELRIPLSDIDYDQEDEQAIHDVIHCRRIPMGNVTKQLEAGFAKLTGAKHAFAVSNSTQALHLAYLTLGIGLGDEVILPSLTFVATSNAVLYTNADVCFAEVIGEDELTISPEDIERKITSRTKVITVVHYGGFPCRMPEILDIAKYYDLSVIEDAAHAVGASIEGRSLGTWGDVGCFSLFSNETLATGEGGMLVTNRDDIAEKVKILRSHGMVTLTREQYQGHAYSYDVVDLGYNDRIDEIRSALVLAQLNKLERNNARRKAITEQYRRVLNSPNYDGVGLPFLGSSEESTHHIFPILLPADVKRQIFMENMRKRGVQTSVHYPSIHRFSYYIQRYPGIFLPVTEAISAREVSLPFFPGMNDSDVDYVLKSVQESLTMARVGIVM